MSFSVNGEVLGIYTIDEVTKGDIGLGATTLDTSGLFVAFDNLVVKRP